MKTTDKYDVSMYSDEELSLIFLNEEYYYNQLRSASRREDFSIIESICDSDFIYTDAQLNDLEDTFEEEGEDN
jgi:hypothetical protein